MKVSSILRGVSRVARGGESKIDFIVGRGCAASLKAVAGELT